MGGRNENSIFYRNRMTKEDLAGEKAIEEAERKEKREREIKHSSANDQFLYKNEDWKKRNTGSLDDLRKKITQDQIAKGYVAVKAGARTGEHSNLYTLAPPPPKEGYLFDIKNQKWYKPEGTNAFDRLGDFASVAIPIAMGVMTGGAVSSAVGGSIGGSVAGGATGGAITGGFNSVRQGGDFWKGAGQGALTGAVSGGAGAIGQSIGGTTGAVAGGALGGAGTAAIRGGNSQEILQGGLMGGAMGGINSGINQLGNEYGLSKGLTGGLKGLASAAVKGGNLEQGFTGGLMSGYGSQYGGQMGANLGGLFARQMMPSNQPQRPQGMMTSNPLFSRYNPQQLQQMYAQYMAQRKG